MAAAEKQRVLICKPMTETQYVSMLKHANINGTQQEEIARHLCYHLGKKFLPSKFNGVMLCEDHAEVHIDSIMHMYKDCREEEKVEYSIKDIDIEISNQSLRLLESRKIKPEDAVGISCVSGGDHGDIVFQFGATIIAETTNEKHQLRVSCS